MAQKNINARLQNKHDVEANWVNAIDFIPLQGEIIVYDVDENYNYERIKIGDGTTKINDLSFVTEPFEAAVLYEAQELTNEQKAQARENIDKYVWYTIRTYGINEETTEVADMHSNVNMELAIATANVSGAGDDISALGEVIDWSEVFLSSLNDSAKLTNVRYIISNCEALVASGAFPFTGGYEVKFAVGGGGNLKYNIKGAKELRYSFSISYNPVRNSYALTWGDSYTRFGTITYDKTNDVILADKLVFFIFDETLTKLNRFAEAKVVGDALALKIDKSEIATDDEILELLAQEDMLPVVADSDGALLADENNNILLW